jgi:hypothetical protein
MTPSQRTILSALAAGSVGFLVIFAMGVTWPIAALLGISRGAVDAQRNRIAERLGQDGQSLAAFCALLKGVL